MISEQLGAVNEIKTEAKNAFRCPCFNHAINLAISKSSNVPSIRNSIGIIKEVISFFKMSAKRMFVLKKYCSKKLKNLCETRWIDRIESVSEFSCEFENIVYAFEEIAEWGDCQTTSKAKILMKNLLDVEFLVSLQCQVPISFLFLPVANLLQKECMDVLNARSLIELLREAISDSRKNSDDEFKSIFKTVLKICENLNVEVKVPRLSNKQKHRGNVPHDDPSDYFKKTIYIPLLNNILMDINDRFSESLMDFMDLTFLIPKQFVNLTSSDIRIKIEKISTTFQKLLDIDKSILEHKLYSEILQMKVSLKDSKHNTFLISFFFLRSFITFPYIEKLLDSAYRIYLFIFNF